MFQTFWSADFPHVRNGSLADIRIVVAAEDTSVQEWVARVVEKAVSESWPKVAKEEEKQ
ncbi:MAG: hypothetical protein ACE5OQ_12650 [Woeseia sp.]